MAKKAGSKRSTGGGKSNDFGGYTFINVSLSKDDKAWLASADCELEFPLKGMLDIVSEGYKVSLKFDRKNNTYIASLADTDPESPTYKSILSGRGATSLNAWYALMYRHIVLLQTDWASAADGEGNSDFN